MKWATVGIQEDVGQKALGWSWGWQVKGAGDGTGETPGTGKEAGMWE